MELILRRGGVNWSFNRYSEGYFGGYYRDHLLARWRVYCYKKDYCLCFATVYYRHYNFVPGNRDNPF